jgi:hypothetical protein
MDSRNEKINTYFVYIQAEGELFFGRGKKRLTFGNPEECSIVWYYPATELGRTGNANKGGQQHDGGS